LTTTPDDARDRRERATDTDELRSVRLIRKYAERIDGVDLEGAAVGDRLLLPPREADLLIAEGWAEPDNEPHIRLLPRRAVAADRARTSRKRSKD
jgi:hypothetical protein